MKAPKCRSCRQEHWSSAPCSAAFIADTPTVARVCLRDAVAKVPAKKAPKKAKAVTLIVDKPSLKDTVTLRRRGRPLLKPDGKLTDAERAKRYRESKKARGSTQGDV